MCVATALTAALTLGGGLMSAAATRAQADAQARAYENQAETARRNARLAELAGEREMERGAREEQRLRRQARQFQGTQRAQLAASGAQISGSALSVLADTAQGIEEDATAIRYNALQNKWERDMQAANFLNQGNAAEASAARARSAGGAGVFSTVLDTALGVTGILTGPSAGVRVSDDTITIRKNRTDPTFGWDVRRQRWGL